MNLIVESSVTHNSVGPEAIISLKTLQCGGRPWISRPNTTFCSIVSITQRDSGHSRRPPGRHWTCYLIVTGCYRTSVCTLGTNTARNLGNTLIQYSSKSANIGKPIVEYFTPLRCNSCCRLFVRICGHKASAHWSHSTRCSASGEQYASPSVARITPPQKFIALLNYLLTRAYPILRVNIHSNYTCQKLNYSSHLSACSKRFFWESLLVAWTPARTSKRLISDEGYRNCYPRPVMLRHVRNCHRYYYYYYYYCCIYEMKTRIDRDYAQAAGFDFSL